MKLIKRALVAGLWVIGTSVLAAPVQVSGGSVTAPVDVTPLIIANQDINFLGGNYIVMLPPSGTATVSAQSADAALTTNGSTRTGNVGFSAKDNPTLAYTGIISGIGTLIVRSSFNGQQPGAGQLFTGGVLMFTGTSAQTWGLDGVPSGGHNPAALVIDPNATVSFFFPGRLDAPASIGAPKVNVFPASSTKSRNIVNNGYLYSSTMNVWGSITGSGVSVFSWWGGDSGNLSSGSVYSASRFIAANGLRQPKGVVFEDQPNGNPTTIVAADIMVFQNGALQWLTSPGTFKVGDTISSISSNISFWALNIQLWARGIFQFTGVALPTAGSSNYKDISPDSEAIKATHYYGTGNTNGFGRAINLQNRVQLLMGDGRQVVTNADGLTNNTFYQGNPFNSLISSANFESAPLGDQNQAMAYNYSGTYRLNTNFNASTDNVKGVIKGIRNSDWVHLLFLNPKEWNAKATLPNNAIVTVPVFFAGLTRIDENAVLELGDGTVGNDVASKTIVINGKTITSRYSDSLGNGMLMTKGNESLLSKGSGRESMNANVKFEIVNNGVLVVNNTPGALSASQPTVAQDVATWVSANQLDGIAGSGRVEQKGRLPLTLGSVKGNPNTYTGGTKVHSGATLLVGSIDALGGASAGVFGSGDVVNQGTVRAQTGIRVVHVSGDFLQ